MRITERMSDSSNLKPQSALLIYSDGEKAVCTSHPVAFEARRKRLVLMAGAPAERAEIIKLAQQLSGVKQSSRRQLLPANLLVATVDCLAWHLPSQRRNIFVDTSDKQFNADINGRDVLHPALLFAAKDTGHGRDLYIWALVDNARPDEATPLFRAPYFNVYQSAHLCEGNYKLPLNCDLAGIPEWEAAFFETHFSHTNLDARQLCAHPHGHNALWREMLKTRLKAFPAKYLLPLKTGERALTLGEVLST